MRLRMLLCCLVGMLVLSGCGAQVAAEPPTPIVETVVVTRVVEVEVTREVERVVTATPLPATPTPAATPTPEAPPLAAGREVEAYNAPSVDHNTVGVIAAGTPLDARSQVEGWVEISLEGREAWIPADAVEGDISALPFFAEALVVMDGEIIQEYLADSVLFKGRVLNMGSQVAGTVRVEIELVDAGDRRLEISDGLIDGFDLAPGADASFQVIMNDVPGWEFYSWVIRWGT